MKLDELGRAFSKRRSWGSSVSMSGYRLDGRASGVRFPAEAGDLCSSLCVQTSSEAHPASYPMYTGGPYRGGKHGGGSDADQAPPPSVEVKND
jgi:hypothetical protein